ncbi:hypothetical protein OROGR_021083 [Orobanche gracilis]
MSTRPRNDDARDLQEDEEEELIELQEEVEQIAQKILEYRTTLPGQLTSTLSSLLASQRPFLPTHLVDEGLDPETGTLSGLNSEAGNGEGLMRENMTLSVKEDSQQAEKIRLLNKKISSFPAVVRDVVSRTKECMARIGKLESSEVDEAEE